MNLSEEVDEEIKTVEKVDSLMFDLIKGIEKLIGKETKIN